MGKSKLNKGNQMVVRLGGKISNCPNRGDYVFVALECICSNVKKLEHRVYLT